jgi:hypothetical protein
VGGKQNAATEDENLFFLERKNQRTFILSFATHARRIRIRSITKHAADSFAPDRSDSALACAKSGFRRDERRYLRSFQEKWPIFGKGETMT